MRNLIYFLQRYYLFFLFLILEGFSFRMLVNHNNFQQAAVVNSSNELIGSIYQSISGFSDYLNLKYENELLQKENSMYRSGIISSFYQRSGEKKLQIDTSLLQQFTYMPAKVVNNSINRRNNYLTLNRGSLDGVKEKMGVVCPEGVVGIVMKVSDHFCTVLSVLNKNAKISAKIKENNYFGSLVWDGSDPEYATLIDINRHVEVKKNQTIVTSMHSTIFPEDINIGKIEEVNFDEGGNFYKLKIKLSTHFGNLSSVYIIDNLMKSEIEELEAQNESDGSVVKTDTNKSKGKQ